MRLTLNGGNWFEENTNAQTWTWYQAGEIGWLGTYAGSFKPVAASRTIVEAIGNYWDTRIAITRDNGALWALTGDTGDAALNLFVSYHPQDPAVVYAGGNLSADSGETYTPVNFGGTYTRPEIVGMCYNYPDVIYAMDHDRSVLLRSRDRAATWSEYCRPGWQMRKMDPLPTFCADPSDTSVVYSIDASGDLARFDGVSWESLGVLSVAGGPSWSYIRCVTVDPTHPEVIYAGMSGHGTAAILRSVDTGNTWVDISFNLPRIGGGGLAVNPHTGELWKGSVAGTWILPPPYGAGIGGVLMIRGSSAQVRPRLVVIGVGRPLAEGVAAYDLRGRRAEGNVVLSVGGAYLLRNETP